MLVWRTAMSATILSSAAPPNVTPLLSAVSEPLPRKLWTRDEYYLAAEQGVFDGQRVELIEGEIISMAPQSSEHFSGIQFVSRVLKRVLPPDCHVRQQGPLQVSEVSEPEPDFCLVRGAEDDYVKAHPTSALLVVEVANTSLEFDRKLKPHLYAEAIVPEYWVLDLLNRQLHVFRGPLADAAAPGGHRYETSQTIQADGIVSPLAVPDATICVQEMLPNR